MRLIYALAAALAFAAVAPLDARAEYNGDVACSQLPALTGDVTTAPGSCPASVASGATLTDTINQEFHRASATLTATSNTTLATVTGLTQALTAGKTYVCSGHLSTSSGSSGGFKLALVATGGLTATSASFTGFAWNAITAVAQTTVTALGSNIVANTAVVTDVYINGAIVVNVAGTINVQAAQNVSNGTATTVLLNSTFACVRVN
jgi:hypothetical protein